MVIYDPLVEKAFCKDFMLSLNQREDIFPEYPLLYGVEIIRKIKNVWKAWLEDTEEAKLNSFERDRRASDSFYLNTLIKDAEDAQGCVDILRDSFDLIKIYQKHLQARSDKYPEIGWDVLWESVNHVNSTSKLLTNDKKLTRA